jgi:predicted nucleic-acid-binding Zn-ribbon protein
VIFQDAESDGFAMEKCPKCLSDQRVRAEVSSEGSPLGGIRFHPDDLVKFSRRTKLAALACPSCGFVEFYLLSEKEFADPPGLGTWVFA